MLWIGPDPIYRACVSLELLEQCPSAHIPTSDRSVVVPTKDCLVVRSEASVRRTGSRQILLHGSIVAVHQ